MESELKVTNSLLHWLAKGKLDSLVVLPALQRLSGESGPPASLLELVESLGEAREPELLALAEHVRRRLRTEALDVHEQGRSGGVTAESQQTTLLGVRLEIAKPWTFGPDPSDEVETANRTARHFCFLKQNQAKAPLFFAEFKTRLEQDLAAASAAIAPRFDTFSPEAVAQLERAWPADLPGRAEVLRWARGRALQRWKPVLEKARQLPGEMIKQTVGEIPAEGELLAALESKYLTTKDARVDQTEILDLLCAWPTPAACPLVAKLVRERWAQDRVVVNLTLRFGQPTLNIWADWELWLAEQTVLYENERQIFGRIIEQHAPALLLILYSQLAERDSATFDALVQVVYETGPVVQAEEFVAWWAKYISMPEQRALLGLPELAPPIIQPPPLPITTPLGAGALKQPQPPPLPVAPLVPPKPSLWEKHIQPLFVENWYIVAGIAMVILGSSLLAYYTWDKHWLLRYTIMPVLLAVFTRSLAGAGRWIEKQKH